MEEIKYKLEQHYKLITENKKSQLISESTLRIISAYYLSDKKKEKLLHNFLKGLKFHKGFFNSIIASLRQIKYITNENKFIKNESDKILRKISVVSSEDNDSTHSTPLEKNYISNNDDLFPLLNLDLDSLHDFCLNLIIKSQNKKYNLIMNKIFIEGTEKIKKKIKGSKTIIFYIDKNTIKDDKKNPCLKFYNKNKIENCLCINLLLKALRIRFGIP